MKTNQTVKISALALTIILFFSSCGKNPYQRQNPIQQGRTIIQINAIRPGNVPLQLRYNNVIDAPIKVTIAFYLTSGDKKEVQVTIPANNKHLIQWGQGDFINSWDYSEYYDSTGIAPTPSIDRSWDISSIKITGVSCTDKEYGFIVLTTNDWIFYKPKDSITSVNFVVNKDTVSYSDYDFINNNNQFNTSLSNYFFNFFNNHIFIFSDTEIFPLSEGMTMDIPLMVYFNKEQKYGSQPDGPQASSNGSTLKLTITKLTGTHFDATFSGKLWSSRQADTLRISYGQIKNALLPEKVD